MNADDLIAEFNELADDDPEIRIYRTRVGDAETVRLVPSYNKGAVQRFKALATDAAALFDLPGPSDPVASWLCFVLDHAPELVEDGQQGPVRSLGYAIEPHDDGTERRVPYIAQTLPNAASASALVVRRCRRPIEQGEWAQAGQARFGKARLTAEDRKEREKTISTYIRKQREKGVKIEHITRDGIARATGIPATAVSGTPAWLTLDAEKKQAKAKPPRRGQSTTKEDDLLRGKAGDKIDTAIDREDWEAVEKAQQRQQRSHR